MSGKPGLSFLTPFLPSTSFLGVHSLCWDLHPPARDGKGEMVTYPLCPDCHSQRCLSSNNTVPKQLHSFWGIKCSLLSHVWLFVIPWTVLHQAPLSIRFSRQECWAGLLFPSPGELPNPGIKPGSPALQADSYIVEQECLWIPWARVLMTA